MDTDTLVRIQLELILGKPPAREDTPAEAQLRLQLSREIEEIHARGDSVLVPYELPHPVPGNFA